MSENNLSQENLQALVAGIGSRLRNIFRGLRRGGGWANSGGNSPEARRARVALQPRDRKGRWIPTGANLRANIDIPAVGGGRRVISASNLKAIGSTPDGKKIRALVVNNDHVKDHPDLAEGNVIELSPKNAELLVAKLDRDFLKKKGIDPDLQHDLPKTLQELPDKVENLNAKEADELDIDLALGGLEEDEDKELRAERDAEPLAKLPPALAEQALEGKEVSEIVKKAEKGKWGGKRFEDLTPEQQKEALEDAVGMPLEESIRQAKEGYTPYRESSAPKSERAKAPIAYGVKNREKFIALPDGTVLDQYDRAQFYPSPEDYRGAYGSVSRQLIKKDGKWHIRGKNGEAKGKPLENRQISELLRGGWLSDTGAGAKLEDGKKVPAWADEVPPSPEAIEDIKPDAPAGAPASPDDLDSLDDEDFEDVEEVTPEPVEEKPEPKKPEPTPEPALTGRETVTVDGKEFRVWRNTTSSAIVKQDHGQDIYPLDNGVHSYGPYLEPNAVRSILKKAGFNTNTKKIGSNKLAQTNIRGLGEGGFTDGKTVRLSGTRRGPASPIREIRIESDLGSDIVTASDATKAVIKKLANEKNLDLIFKTITNPNGTERQQAYFVPLKTDSSAPAPEPTEEVSPDRQAVQKRIDDLKAKVESDPDKREVLDSIGEARKALNRGKIDDASSWLDEAEVLDAEIDRAKANKKRTDDLKANVPEVKEDPDKVDRTLGDEKAGYLAKEMGKPGSKQREYFWQTVDRITSDPKQKLNGFAQNRITDAYTSELLEKLDISNAKLDPQLESLVDGTKTRAEVISAIKEKVSADIDKLIKAIPRARLPREGNKSAIKTALEFSAEDKIDERLDDLLPSLENKLNPAGREYSKEELDAMSRIDRVNAVQGLEPITEETKKTPVSEIAKLKDVSDFDGDFGTLPNGENIIPSEEQKNILSAVISGAKRIVVNALAGSGKTTTLVGAAKALTKRDPNARVFVWQFGRDNREQAQSRFDANTSVIHTFDSAGFNFGDKNLADNFQKAKERPALYNTTPENIAGELRIEGDMPTKTGENITLAQQASLVKDIVDRFSYSADTEINDRHIYDPEDSLTPDGRKKLLKYARRYWRTATASTSFPKYSKTREGRRSGGYTGPGSIPPTNNIITKKWALSNPDLGSLKHPDGSPITHVFVDEAQDINPVISDLLEKQGDNVQIVTVGDSNQAIYAFRGAVNGLSRMNKKSEVDLRLTQTRRFGKGLLDLPNAALNLLGFDSRIDSPLEGGEYVDNIEIDGSQGLTAVIVRNNYNGVNAILGMLAREKKVAVPSAFKDDLMNAVTAMEWLDADPELRGPRPAGFPEDFATISSMRGLAAFARNKDNAKTRAAFWHRILTGDSFDGSVPKLKEFAEKVSVFGQGTRGSNFSGEEGSTGVLATTENGDITYTIKDGAIYLDGKGMNAKGQNSNKSFKWLAMGGHKNESIRSGENPNWTQYLPGGIRKPDQAPTWRIVRVPDAKAPGGARYETLFTMPNEADRKEYLENLSSIFSEDIAPDVVITTAHRSKGLEFDNVIIGDDFPGPGTEDKDEKQSETGIPSQDELNLAFVAVTRAKKKLTPGSLGWLSEYKGEDGLNKANSELGRAGTPNPYKDKITEPSAGAAFDFSDITLDGGAQGPRTGEDDEEIEALRKELTRDVSNIFEVSPDSFEGNIGSYFEDPDAEGVYVKLTDFVRSEDEDGEPIFEMYGKYADGSDFEGIYGIDRRLREVTFAEPVAKTPTKKKTAEKPAPVAAPDIKKTKAANILEGSSLYDGEGNEMGEVLSKKKQVQKSTGREVVAVTYRDKDGNEQVKRYFADADVDVDNKGLDVVETPSKPEPKAKPKTVAKTDGDSPEVAQAKADWADVVRLKQEVDDLRAELTQRGVDLREDSEYIKKSREAFDRHVEVSEKYPELKAALIYASRARYIRSLIAKELGRLQTPSQLESSSAYRAALADRHKVLKDKIEYHRAKFLSGLDKGKLNLKEVPIDQSLLGNVMERKNTPVNKLNTTELPTIFGTSWLTNRDGTFSKVVDGVRWNIRENRDGTISIRNRTHGVATQRFKSWEEAEAAFPDLLDEGRKQNRENLKQFISPYDTDGSISKLIDDGATGEEIHNALLGNSDFMDALARREILPISYMSKIDRIVDNPVVPPAINPIGTGNKKLSNPEIPTGYIQTPAGIIPQRFAGRDDDGSEFDVPVDMEAIRKLKPGSRQEQLEQIFDSFPDAKIAADGSIVIYRKTKAEPHGPKRGQKFTTELRVQGDARQNNWRILVKVTDPRGDSQEFMHYSGHNSWESLIGRADESREGNGISDMLDKYFNRDANFFKRKGKRLGWGPEKIAKQERVWGGVSGALKRLRTSNPEDKLKSIITGNGKGQTDLALRTIEEHTAITLNGIAEELATDLRWWRKRFSGINSFWDALDKNDNEAAATLFNHFSLSLPDNDDARQRALSVMSDGIDRLYSGASAQKKKDLLEQAAAKLKRGVVPAEEVDPNAKPFVDKYGATLKEGDHVEWESNVYGKAVGQIVRFLPLDMTKDGEFSFTDYVMVKFKDKKKPERLVASNMKKVEKDTPITKYSFWVRNDDLKIERAGQAGYSYDPNRHAIVDSDGDVVEFLGQDNDGDGGDNDTGDDDGGDNDTGDGDNDTGDGDGGGDGGGDTTPTPPTPPAAQPVAQPAAQPAGQTTATDSSEEFLDVENLTPDNITAGAFANPTKKIKTTKVNRKRVGELLPFGNVQKDPSDANAALRAKNYFTQNNVPEGSQTGLVDDPENTIVYDPKKSSKAKRIIGGMDSQDSIVVVKPSPETKKAKDTLVAKGQDMWEKAKASAGYEKVKNLRKQIQTLIESREEIKKFKDLETPEEQAKYFAAKGELTLEIKKLQNAWILERALFMRDSLKEAGVAMGGRSIKDFTSLVSIKTKDPKKREAVLKAFDEALSFMPDASVDNLISYLRDTNNKLDLSTDARGSFSSSGAIARTSDGGPKGSIEIKVSGAGLLDDKSAFGSEYTDTMLHELWHFVQFTNPNLRAVESSYMFDKLVDPKTGEVRYNYDSVKGYNSQDKEIGIQGMFQEEYMSKIYPKKGLNAVLNPEDESTELSTVLMQGLFTNPRYSGAPNGRKIYTKDGRTSLTLIDSRDESITPIGALPLYAYYNPADGKYYRDSAFSIPVEKGTTKIVNTSGYGVDDQGEEDELMGLAFGLMYAFDGGK
jgi:hypothetical protein